MAFAGHIITPAVIGVPPVPVCGIILAGGDGTRLSIPGEMPKQFQPIVHPDMTMLQTTFSRLVGFGARPFIDPGNIFVLTRSNYVGLVREQLPAVPAENVIGQPINRNTGPAISVAMHFIAKCHPRALAAVVPSDHYIENSEVFIGHMFSAMGVAMETGGLVTFGITPDRPETSYGYIELGDRHSDGVRRAVKFVEKPDEARAAEFVRAGNYLWNSGMFVWTAEGFLSSLKRHQPDMHGGLEHAFGMDPHQLMLERSLHEFLTGSPGISIDHALMEPAAREGEVFVIPWETGWADIGTWASLGDQVRKGRISPPQHIIEELLARGLII